MRLEQAVAQRGRGTGSRGFTLLEVIIAIAIIGIMAAAIGPMAVRQINQARERATADELDRIRDGLLAYYEDLGHFPEQEVGLTALVSDADANWRGPYIDYSRSNPLDAVRSDSFGEAYLYDLSPDVSSGAAADLIVASKGVNRRADLGSVDGAWPLADVRLHDDLIVAISHAGIDRSNRDAASAELEALAEASRAYYRANGDFPAELLDLAGGFIDAGIDQDAFYDGWRRDYLSAASAGANPVLSIWSSGPDQLDDDGENDDILIEVNSALIEGAEDSPDEWDWSEEGNYTLFLATTAQAALDGEPDLRLRSDRLDRILDDLGLSAIYRYDEWGSRMMVNEDDRRVYSPGPDGRTRTTADNIPPGVGP